MLLLFWISALWLVYVYLGYPLIAKQLAKSRAPATRDRDYQPEVSILIAAYNEAECIEQTLLNKIAQAYPPEKLEILVVSDESDDGTDEIVQRVAEQAHLPITLIRQQPRQGKTAGLNRLSQLASGKILLFSDANSIWSSNTVTELVSCFADPEVGYVTGKMVYLQPDGSMVGDGCSGYMKYENWLRGIESRLNSIVGVDGGIDAIRASLFQPLDADQLPDFVQPLRVVEQGFRVQYCPDAILKESALAEGSGEYRMRVRVSLRALWALWSERALFNPSRFGLFSWQLASHKLLRYLVFIPLVGVLLASFALQSAGGFYQLALWSQLLFYLLAAMGLQYERNGRSFSFTIPYYFCLINAASAQATWLFLRGRKIALWKPRGG